MLKNVKGFIPRWNENATLNYAYFPIVFESDSLAGRCFEALKIKEIFARRYFYPSLAETLPYVSKKEMPVTDDIASRVICLPLYFDLSVEEVDMICRLILRVRNN